MPNRSWRSGSKQPPQQREKKDKKSLEDTCVDLKKTVTSEHQARQDAAKRELERAQEDEQMRMVYGPNWKQGLPAWAADSQKVSVQKRVESPQARDEDYGDDEEDGERVIPFPRDSEVRFSKKRRAS